MPQKPQIIRLFGIQLRILSEFHPWTFECAVCMPRIQIMLWPQSFFDYCTLNTVVFEDQRIKNTWDVTQKKKKKEKKNTTSPSFSLVLCSFAVLNSQQFSHLSPHIMLYIFSHLWSCKTGEIEDHQTVLCYRKVQKRLLNSILQLHSHGSRSSTGCASSTVCIHQYCLSP